jgi:putative transposase
LSTEEKRRAIEFGNKNISLSRQCELLGLSRSALYYRGMGVREEDLELMRLLDEQYTKTPFYGSRRMTASLRSAGYSVNRKRVVRLMRDMGLEAIYPKPKLSRAARGHKIYPYLLRTKKVTAADQVWCADITYIRLSRGFLYLVAVMDWWSRYVLSWELSITLDADFCVSALERALESDSPEIFNTDQGVQFTSEAFLAPLKEREILISMDGRGRALDNVFVERLWRSVKYEEVYLKDYRSVIEAAEWLGAYFRFYNTERLHQSLEYRTPEEVYKENRTACQLLVGNEKMASG